MRLVSDEHETPDKSTSFTATTSGSTVTKVTTYTTRSTRTTLIFTLIQAIRPHLIDFPEPFPSGSPQLDPPSHLHSSISARYVADVHLYDFAPKKHSSNATAGAHKQEIYYLAGGGFRAAPSKDHWKLCAEFAAQLDGLYSVTLVSYPLAPNSPAEKSLPILRKWLRAVVDEAKAGGRSVTLMGDSAGGNVVLSLGFWWADRMSQSPPSDHTSTTEATANRSSGLSQIVAISPPTDFRNTNPDIDEIGTKDPVMTRKIIEDSAKVWCGSLNRSDPQVSPLLADFGALRKSGIMIHGVIGTYDLLAPDAILFRQKCQDEMIPGEWLQWERQMHCFPLSQSYGIPEGKQGVEWIVDVLKRNV